MKKFCYVIILTALVSAIIFTAGCIEKQGGLPTLKIGDQWAVQFSSEGTMYTVTSEVIGEDTIVEDTVYLVQRSIVPSTSGVTDISIGINKETLRPATMEMSGEFMDEPLLVTINYSYDPSISP